MSDTSKVESVGAPILSGIASLAGVYFFNSAITSTNNDINQLKYGSSAKEDIIRCDQLATRMMDNKSALQRGMEAIESDIKNGRQQLNEMTILLNKKMKKIHLYTSMKKILLISSAVSFAIAAWNYYSENQKTSKNH